MDDQEARSILSVYRAGEGGLDDTRVEEALRKAEADPELAQWWSQEKELDRLIAAKLNATHVPAGLKARIASAAEPRVKPVGATWRRAILLAAASIVALAVLFSSWRGPFQPAVSLADYRDEMVSFIKVAPSLELESPRLSRLTDFLAKAEAPAQFTVPQRLRQYETVGCRVLRFRGHDVSLVCFKIGGDQLVHLFVTKASSVPARGTASDPVFVAEGNWMTATWTEQGQTYLLAVKGDRSAAEKFMSTS